MDSSGEGFIPCPTWLYRPYGIQGYVMSSLLVAYYPLFVWAIYRKSPKSMGTYKWYIISNSTCCALFEIVLALVHAEPVLSHRFIVGRGIFDWFPHAPEVFYKFYADAFVFFFWCTVYTTTAMFLYRYSQMMDTLLYRRLLAEDNGILWVMLIVVVLAGAFTVPMHFCWGSMEEMKRRVEVEDPVLHERIKDNPMMVIEAIFSLDVFPAEPVRGRRRHKTVIRDSQIRTTVVEYNALVAVDRTPATKLELLRRVQYHLSVE